MTDQRIKEILDAIPVCEGGIFMPQETYTALQQLRDEMLKEMAAMLGEAWQECVKAHMECLSIEGSSSFDWDKFSHLRKATINSLLNKHL